MTAGSRRYKSALTRIRGRVRRLLFGDLVVVPSRLTDPAWHLERARARVRGGDLIVRFDNLDADIALDARSDLALRALADGTYEPELLAAIPELLGAGDAINVGANVGILAIVMRRSMALTTRLLCVEPIEECIVRLSQNLKRAGTDQGVIIQRSFATDTPHESQQIWTVPGRPEYSSGGRLVHHAVAAAEHVAAVVPAIRLDDAVAEEHMQPTCIVMDCEGGEYNALRGAVRTINTFQPTIVMEFDPALLQANGRSAATFLHFLTDIGYRCITLTDPPTQATETFAGTVIAVPASRTDAVTAAIQTVYS